MYLLSCVRKNSHKRVLSSIIVSFEQRNKNKHVSYSEGKNYVPSRQPIDIHIHESNEKIAQIELQIHPLSLLLSIPDPQRLLLISQLKERGRDLRQMKM